MHAVQRKSEWWFGLNLQERNHLITVRAADYETPACKMFLSCQCCPRKRKRIKSAATIL
jgi:hypothetical protein